MDRDQLQKKKVLTFFWLNRFLEAAPMCCVLMHVLIFVIFVKVLFVMLQEVWVLGN